MSHPHRVLVVDDDPDVTDVVAFQVRLLGHEPIVATSLRAALAIIEAPEAAVDVVITDLDLAGEDGRGILRACRAGGLAAVAMSAASSPDDLGVPWLHKPVDLAQLSAVLGDRRE